jgi:HD-like signal output (HDOD) protein
MDPRTVPESLWPRLAAFAPGATLQACMEALADPKSGPASYAAVLDRNPAFLHLIQGLDVLQKFRKKWIAEDPGAKAAGPEGAPPKERPVPAADLVAVFGRTQTRNLVACLRMLRATGAPMPRKIKDSFTFKLGDLIPRAIAAEEWCESHRYAHSDQAFLGGLMYDWFSTLVAQQKAPKEVKAEIDSAWKEGFRTAQIAHRISTNFRDFPHSEHIFTAALLLPLTRPWMLWTWPEWKDFRARVDALPSNRREAWLAQEPREFSLTGTEILAMSAAASGFLAPVAHAIAASRDPIRVRSAEPSLYRFALVLRAARILCPLKNDETVDPASAKHFSRLDRWVLRELKLKDTQWAPVMKRLEEGPK